jgi:uncharacterized protein YdeI (YjbR/CyaY-like superfamily)
MNPQIDIFIAETTQWQAELQVLRSIILSCGLTETLKWGVPCYTFEGGNVLLIHGFKDYCAVGFFKGALLKDEQRILIQQTENSQAARQIRFANMAEIVAQETLVKAYIYEAITVEKAGLKVDYKKDTSDIFPETLVEKMAQDSTFKTAFTALTPGRQRGYMLHFAAAKQAQTQMSRIENCTQKIMCGKGFHDCTCGLSQKMPTCDGSHKQLKP